MNGLKSTRLVRQKELGRKPYNYSLHDHLYSCIYSHEGALRMSRHRRTKKEMNILKSEVVNLLNNGFQLQDIEEELHIRKDQLARIFMELYIENLVQPTRKIVSATKAISDIVGNHHFSYYIFEITEDGCVFLKPFDTNDSQILKHTANKL